MFLATGVVLGPSENCDCYRITLRNTCRIFHAAAHNMLMYLSNALCYHTDIFSFIA